MHFEPEALASNASKIRLWPKITAKLLLVRRPQDLDYIHSASINAPKMYYPLGKRRNIGFLKAPRGG